MNHYSKLVANATAGMLLCTLPAITSASLIGPSPYVRASDSPFSGVSFSYFYLENFEDLSLNTPGVAVDHGLPINKTNSFAIDSVDADDGLIDGSGSNGASILDPTSMTFTFNASVLGSLPTHAGIVWTDGTPGGPVKFEAFDQNGTSLGSLISNLGDANFFGTTAEDRFFGAVNAGGISSILITDNGTANYLEVDHLQYGLVSTANIPAPGTGLLLLSGLFAVSFSRFRRLAILKTLESAI